MILLNLSPGMVSITEENGYHCFPTQICDALVQFVQFKKCAKHPWRSVNTKRDSPPCVCFTFSKLY